MKNKMYFNPGCALSIYKPYMEEKILSFLNANYEKTEMHNICCRHNPQLEKGSTIINVCAGCDKRFGGLYEGVSTISLWEILDNLDTFSFSDYSGLKLSIHDPCPVRNRPEVHKAIRNLLKKMKIEIIEAKANSSRSICCGDTYYGKLPIDKIEKQMTKRANSMPCNDVAVYCVSCIKAIHVGGKKPRHLVDLLFSETTEPQVYDIEKWHGILDEYIDNH